jgi:hypothetical protein
MGTTVFNGQKCAVIQLKLTEVFGQKEPAWQSMQSLSMDAPGATVTVPGGHRLGS